MLVPISSAEAKGTVALFAELISELKPDPHCKVTGCWGRGYLGVQIISTDQGQKIQLITCKCVRMGLTEYSRLFAMLEHDFTHLTATLDQNFRFLHRRTFFGFFEYEFARLWRALKSTRKASNVQPSAERAGPDHDHLDR